MNALQRTAMVLIGPAIAYLGAACDKTDAPMETAAPAAAPSFSGSSPDGGGKFLLNGSAYLDQDPENPANDVIRINTTLAPGQCVAPTYLNCPSGSVSRAVNVKIDKLDNMVEFKAWFESGYVVGGPVKTCGGGSPRIQLAIDLNNDGNSDGNAFGYFGDPATGWTACPVETWLYEDFTGAGDFLITGGPLFPSTGYSTPNEELEWDLTQFACIPPMVPPGTPTDPCIAHPGYAIAWSTAEQAIGVFPNHLVCTVALVDDAYTGSPGGGGIAYYDLFSAGTLTWTGRSDIGGRGFAKGCARPDHGDDHHEGDFDNDHDRDNADDRYEHDRHERWKDRS